MVVLALGVHLLGCNGVLLSRNQVLFKRGLH